MEERRRVRYEGTQMNVLVPVTSEKIMSSIRRRRVVAGVMILLGAILLTYHCENATNRDAENAFRDITFSRLAFRDI